METEFNILFFIKFKEHCLSRGCTTQKVSTPYSSQNIHVTPSETSPSTTLERLSLTKGNVKPGRVTYYRTKSLTL